MSDLPTQLLDERIAAIVERVKILAGERDAFRQENQELRSRLERHEREQARLKTVLDEAVSELREG